MNKRRFLEGVCGGFASLILSAGARRAFAGSNLYRRFPVSTLVDVKGRSLSASALKPGQTLVFYYPFVTTPCFLINLGQNASERVTLETERGENYSWPGGVGPEKSIVAFSAICAHKMSHPTPKISFINFRQQPVTFVDASGTTQHRGNVIQCCSERSVYDAAAGAQVLSGPAPQPLTAIALEYIASNDTLQVNGCYGGDRFKEFMQEFKFRLNLEFGVDDPSAPIGKTTRAISMNKFSEQSIRC